MAAQLGGELTEIDGACRPLQPLAERPDAKDDPAAQAAWIQAWSGLARAAAGLRRARRGAGPSLVGGSQVPARLHLLVHRRAHDEPQAAARRRALYAAMVRCFAKSVSVARRADRGRDDPLRRHDAAGAVSPRAAAGPRPAMIHFDGFDVTKEWMSLCGIADEFARRGVSTLMVDHPGIGAALRLQGLAMNPDSERWARGRDGLARAARRRRRAPGRRHRDEPGRLLRAARRGVRAAAGVLRRLGRALGQRRLARPHAARRLGRALGDRLARPRALVLRRRRRRRGRAEDRADDARGRRREDHLSAARRARRERPPGAARAGGAHGARGAATASARRCACSITTRAASSTSTATCSRSRSTRWPTGSRTRCGRSRLDRRRLSQ